MAASAVKTTTLREPSAPYSIGDEYAGRIALRLPQHLAVRLIESHHGGAGAARRDDEAVPIHQRRFADPPMRHLAVKVVHHVEAPDAFARSRVETHQHAVRRQGVETVAIHGRRTARPMSARFPERDARVGAPQLLAGVRIERQHVLFVAVLALNEEAAIGNRGGRVALAEAVDFPDQRRPALRPRVKQAGLRGDSIAVRTAPLRPVGGPGEGAEKQAKKRSESATQHVERLPRRDARSAVVREPGGWHRR